MQHIEPWLSSGQDHERERAVTVTADILAFYLENLTVKVCTRARLFHDTIFLFPINCNCDLLFISYFSSFFCGLISILHCLSSEHGVFSQPGRATWSTVPPLH